MPKLSPVASKHRAELIKRAKERKQKTYELIRDNIKPIDSYFKGEDNKK